MSIPAGFVELTKHPAPGLHFPAHAGAGTGERVLAAPHRFCGRANDRALAQLRELTARCPAARDQFLEFYSRWNGCELCRLPFDDEKLPLLTLLSIEAWKAATDELATGDLSFLLDGLDEILPRDGFVVIGAAPSEHTRLLLSLTGTWDDVSSAGAICYAAMDPVLASGQPIASSFFELLEQIGRGPANFFEKISSTYFVANGGKMWGDVADRYIPNIGAFAAQRPTDEQPKERDHPGQGSLF